MFEAHRTRNDPLDGRPVAQPEPRDAAEIWGKRVGRALGFAFAAFLIWRLIAVYVFPSA